MKKSWCNNLFPAVAAVLLFAGAIACSERQHKPTPTAVVAPDTVKMSATSTPAMPDTTNSAISAPGNTDGDHGASAGHKTPGKDAARTTPPNTSGQAPSGSGGKTDGKVIVPPPPTHSGPGKSVKHHTPDDNRLDSLKRAKSKIKKKE